MPLLDHFHPPVKDERDWHGFHQAWACYLAQDLNARLPKGWFAEPNVAFGIEIDVAAFERAKKSVRASRRTWEPAAPTLTVPFTILTDVVEVQVFGNEGARILAGAIELVSPANKNRPSNRNAFVTKVASLLQLGIGTLIVDVVTERRKNLHDALMKRVAPGVDPWKAPLYAASYRPEERDEHIVMNMWLEKLTIGGTLPTLPLWMLGDVCLPINLEAAYRETCKNLRFP